MGTRTYGLRRFTSDLPAVDEYVTLGEGDTAVVSLDGLANRLNLRCLSAKMECQNPTGSYKDRVAAMSISLARQRGNVGWIATSSGNAGMAMAAYGARARIPGFLCLVASAPLEKRLPLLPYGIGLVAVDGAGGLATGMAEKQLMEGVRSLAKRHSLYLGVTAHAFNSEGMRGIDTISYELSEQVPDLTHVYVPTGGGGLLVAIARGLGHRAMNAKVVACQPSGCSPIVQYLDERIPEPVVERCVSGISALQLPRPPDGVLAAEAVVETSGWGTAVSDDAILAAQRLLAELEGIFVEPAAAAGLAALMDDVECGRVGTDAHPVLILSGAGWKDLSHFAKEAKSISIVGIAKVAEYVERWAAHSIRAVSR